MTDRERQEYAELTRIALRTAELASPRLRPADWRLLSRTLAGGNFAATHPLRRADGVWISFANMGDEHKWVRELVDEPLKRLIAAGVLEVLADDASAGDRRLLTLRWRLRWAT